MGAACDGLSGGGDWRGRPGAPGLGAGVAEFLLDGAVTCGNIVVLVWLACENSTRWFSRVCGVYRPQTRRIIFVRTLRSKVTVHQCRRVSFGECLSRAASLSDNRIAGAERAQLARGQGALCTLI